MKTFRAKQIADVNGLDLWWNVHQKEWTLHNKSDVPEKYKSKTFKGYEILDFSESQFEYVCLNLNENEQ